VTLQDFTLWSEYY